MPFDRPSATAASSAAGWCAPDAPRSADRKSPAGPAMSLVLRCPCQAAPALITPSATRHRDDMKYRMRQDAALFPRSEEHTSELQSLMRISYAVFCLKKKTTI